MNIRRFLVMSLAVCLASFGVSLSVLKVGHAQFGPTLPAGVILPVNQFQPASLTGVAGTVTNPASNFVVQVSAGPVYCGGNQSTIAQSQLTLPASRTSLVVYNCPQELVYAKSAVVGPGTSSPDQPGVPTTLLFAIPGIEIPLATVVCNATACGNGGNGSITDARSAAFFPSGGVPMGSVTFANLPALPDGSTIICSSCTQPAAGSVACTTGAAVVLAARVGGAWRCY